MLFTSVQAPSLGGVLKGEMELASGAGAGKSIQGSRNSMSNGPGWERAR